MPFRPLLKTMRPKQWAKNGFVFAALIFDGQLFHPTPFLHTLIGFILFCLLSSVVYIVNDISDLEADRMHPKKRFRPLAAGTLSVRTAWYAVIVLLILIFPAAFWLSPVFCAIAAGYLILNLAYSRWFKHIIVLDVIILAAFYVVRVAAGVELINVARFSPWIYIFTIFLALFLGVGKRRAERNLLVENSPGEAKTQSHRKVLSGYTLPLLDQYLNIVSSMTIITYSLYTFSAPNLPENHSMMLTIPFVIYGIFRYLYLVQVEQSGGVPEEVLFTDRPLQVMLLLYGLVILAVFYLPVIYP